MTTDTIAAISTPLQSAAIGILRLSGPEAVDCAQGVFTPMDGRPLSDHPQRKLIFGTVKDRDGVVIDQALATYTRGPASYTGEDTAELQCHGAPMVLSLALDALFAQGARQAGPGEFTRRAFLNGRLDLVQAEAVADLLDAQSRQSARHAAGKLGGALSRKIGEIYSALTDLMAHFCAVLDYPDEDIDPFREELIFRQLVKQEEALDRLLSSCRRGYQLTKGVPCAIVGRPNAGKSSLLNALAGYERAIVTDIPGTTRDTIEVSVELGGMPIRLIDTAGLRDCDDPVEQLGVARSRGAMEEAALILVLWDGSEGVLREDVELLERAMELAPTILVRTKNDLPLLPLPDLKLPDVPIVAVSAAEGDGLEELERAVAALFPQEEEGYGQLLSNQRQEAAARRAKDALARAREALELGFTPDALLLDVEEAMEALGELTGQSVREDITDRIFQRFCVGK